MVRERGWMRGVARVDDQRERAVVGGRRGMEGKMLIRRIDANL